MLTQEGHFSICGPVLQDTAELVGRGVISRHSPISFDHKAA